MEVKKIYQVMMSERGTYVEDVQDPNNQKQLGNVSCIQYFLTKIRHCPSTDISI